MFAGAPKLVLARGGHVAAEGEVKAPKRVLAPFCHADSMAHSANPNRPPFVVVGLVCFRDFACNPALLNLPRTARLA